MNLDTMTIGELRAITEPALRPYAETRARAMEARLAGYIARALMLEDACDRLYERLPEHLQW